MQEEPKGISRRQFAKAAGVAVAAAAIIRPGTVSATTASSANGDDAFAFALTNFLPMRGAESSLVQSKKGLKFYRNAFDLRHDRYLEINDFASATAQLCTGSHSFEYILSVLESVFGVEKESMRDSVSNYIKFLFEEGFICFVSENLLSTPQKRMNSGLTLHSKSGRSPEVVTKFGENIDLRF